MISDVGLGSECHQDSLCKTSLPPNKDGATHLALGWCCFSGCRLLVSSWSQRPRTIVPMHWATPLCCPCAPTPHACMCGCRGLAIAQFVLQTNRQQSLFPQAAWNSQRPRLLRPTLSHTESSSEPDGLSQEI